MATNWTDPTLTTSSHIRATHLNELRSVVNQNRRPAGLGNYAWTDTPISTSTHIRAVHFTELRSAIQDLWTTQGMGALPNWSYGSAPSGAGGRPISARDTTDLRTWTQQYENATGISYQPVDPLTGPFRGVHLPHGGDLRAIDLTALGDFAPGAAVALLSDVYAYAQSGANPNLFTWLKNNQTNRELFLRYYPCPVVPLNTPGYQSYSNISSSAQHISASAAAQDIVNQVNALNSQGLAQFRVIVGNEPEIEWDTSGSAQWFTSFWNDVDNYFSAIYDSVGSLGRPVELYPPAFLQGAFVAVLSVNYDGTITRSAVSTGGRTSFTGADTDYGAYYAQNLLDHYNNGTSVGRMVVHSYFWPGYQANQVIDKFLPGFIMSRVNNGMPARVTEFGWWPSVIVPNSCLYPPYCCPANLDSTPTSCDGVRTGISASGDYNDYMRVEAKLGGYSFWLLADPTGTAPGAVAVDSSGNIRTWFMSLINYYNQP